MKISKRLRFSLVNLKIKKGAVLEINNNNNNNNLF